ncbi:MAG: glycosyltransferase family 4 protein [Vicinamibacterales bacterium]|jgi:glycosyltransferase involved in cell wall biosynthesis|nr:glycosyltransferase family 4 protein [Vicinamibacterales bacterium]
MTPRRVLALSPVPIEGAGFRFRIGQYIPALERHGFEVTASPFLTSDFFDIVYAPGRPITKLALFIRQAAQRLRDLLAARHYDLFLVYREAFPIGPPLIERMLASLSDRPVVYDFDDAVFLPNASSANQLVSALKWYHKVPSIIAMSDRTIAGNEYLAAYARARTSNVRVIPTCVDTTLFKPGSRPASYRGDNPVVGWIGSHSTTKYLRGLLPILAQVHRRHPFSLYVVGTDSAVAADGMTVQSARWALDREVADFQRCDVGVYPLWDDRWSLGKCGFKAIQFMACGVPVVAAAVGVNCEIIEDGVNGFLAADEREWAEKLSMLLTDGDLRASMGAAARRTIEDRYSLAINAPRFIAVLNEAADNAKIAAPVGAPSR